MFGRGSNVLFSRLWTPTVQHAARMSYVHQRTFRAGCVYGVHARVVNEKRRNEETYIYIREAQTRFQWVPCASRLSVSNKLHWRKLTRQGTTSVAVKRTRVCRSPLFISTCLVVLLAWPGNWRWFLIVLEKIALCGSYVTADNRIEGW